jgi:hypothetical protein
MRAAPVAFARRLRRAPKEHGTTQGNLARWTGTQPERVIVPEGEHFLVPWRARIWTAFELVFI